MDNSKNNPNLDSSLSTWSCPHCNISVYDINKLIDTVYFTDPRNISASCLFYYYLLLTTYYLLLTTYYLLLTTYYLLLTTYYLLPTTYHLLLTSSSHPSVYYQPVHSYFRNCFYKIVQFHRLYYVAVCPEFVTPLYIGIIVRGS